MECSLVLLAYLALPLLFSSGLKTMFRVLSAAKGINKLLNRDIYLAAYPLHDGPCGTGPINTRVEPRTERRLLYSEWARLAVCYKEQPIQLIRRYFGVKTGLYFTWLGFYTGMLLLPAIVGILTAIYGVVMLTVNVPFVLHNRMYPLRMETCDPKIFGNLVLCPACKKSCPYDHLSNKCNFSKIVYLFENPATVAFSIFMALWATIFMEMWKRRQAVLKWEWKLSDLDTLSNLIKPDYEARARVYRLNPVTMNYEPYVPLWERILRISGSTSVVLLMLLLALIAVFGIITYRIILTGLLLRNKQWRQFAPLTTAVTASTLNLVIILIMDRIYARIAEWLTYIEVPRTEEEYEDSYTVKMFLFNFFNTYSSLFYIAFLKGRFSRYPGNPGTLFGYSIEKCPGGCLYEVCVQLAIVMMGKQFFNHLCEIGIPFVKNWWRSRRHEKATSVDGQSLAQWEADYDLEPWTTLSLFDEYLEMAVQFGFVTLFAMAFPLAPLFAFLNNVIEIRVDAYKYTAQLRRPLAQRVPDIGSWQVIFKGMSSLAVIVNAFLIAFTSDTIPRVVYRSTYSSDFSLTGFVNFTLSVFDTSDFEEDARPENATLNGVVIKQCRYFDYREPPGEDNPYSLSLIYWQIFTARLIFVVVFEHVVFAITGLLDTIIPDVPRSVQERIKREQIVTQEVFAEYERTGPGAPSEAVPKTPVAAIQPPAE